MRRLLALIFILVVALVSGCIEDTLEEPTISVSQIKSTAVTIPYDDLMRNNEAHVGKIVYFRGEIIQVGEVSGDTYFLRVATKESYFGYFGDNLLVNYRGARLLDDDIVDLWGKVKGLRTYEAVLGNEVTIPELDSFHLEIVQKAGEE